MLTDLYISGYKSLYNVDILLEPLTVLIGPNGSGKSSVCEAIKLSDTVAEDGQENGEITFDYDALMPYKSKITEDSLDSIFWQGNTEQGITCGHSGAKLSVKIYNFVPTDIMQESSTDMSLTGHGIANSLTKILFDNRDRFIELEQRLVDLVPNIARIKLDQNNQRINTLRLVDRYSGYEIPSQNISDGTLRLLAFLVALYDVEQPDLICFEEPENGVHPWLLNKIMQLLAQVSTAGISGKPTQIIITTHSPVLLNYVQPEQIRAVELNESGATQIRSLPTDTKRFQAALDAYDGELGELWFTNIFGGNPD